MAEQNFKDVTTKDMWYKQAFKSILEEKEKWQSLVMKHSDMERAETSERLADIDKVIKEKFEQGKEAIEQQDWVWAYRCLLLASIGGVAGATKDLSDLFCEKI